MSSVVLYLSNVRIDLVLQIEIGTLFKNHSVIAQIDCLVDAVYRLTFPKHRLIYRLIRRKGINLFCVECHDQIRIGIELKICSIRNKPRQFDGLD